MLTIRPAQLADCDALVSLCHELGYSPSAAGLAQQLQHFQNHPDHAVFVAEAISTEQQPAIGGWIHVHLHCTLQEGQEAEINGLVVSERLRGQGISRQLLRQAEIWAQQQECEAVIVRSNLQRHAAHRFYQQMGYQELKRSIAFRRLLGQAQSNA